MTKKYLSVPAFAKSRGIGRAKVDHWIQTGELEAVNLATDATKRPRWGISLEAIERFESKRLAVQPKPARVQRPKPLTERKYF